ANAVGRVADVQILDRHTGLPLPVHYHRGEYWIAGQPGAKYAIQIRNSRGPRMLAVTSVDGLNVLSGDTADFSQSGYVFESGQRYGIEGWRKSDSQVAAFVFTANGDSYAERIGKPRDMGVIGVALFRERPPVALYSPPVIAAPANSGAGTSRHEKSAELSDKYRESTASAPSEPVAPAAPAAAPAPQQPQLMRAARKLHQRCSKNAWLPKVPQCPPPNSAQPMASVKPLWSAARSSCATTRSPTRSFAFATTAMPISWPWA
ncbi:MAG: hypothetical protein HC765_15395, partial [Brachymonas sp.]|nr:hypothetical protein [Brachymonas sp.]